jgi:hypothetical protein
LINVTLHNRQEITEFRKNLANLKLQTLEFQAITVRKLVEINIIDAIHSRMAQAGFSDKIIDNTFLDRIDFVGPKKVRIYIKSELFAETGFDVALAREKGTKDHSTKRKDGKDSIQAFVDNGVQKFSHGHDVSGLPALKIVENTVKDFAPNVQDDYSRQLREFLSDATGGKL